MKRPAFFDTNIFLYADDASAPTKQAFAVRLITQYQRAGLAVVSLQVMQEYFAAATRKLGVDPAIAQRKVELMGRMRVVRFQEADIVSAIELHRLHKVSFWDSMIIHAAKLSEAEFLFSEDMHPGSVWGGTRVVNPFADPPVAPSPSNV